MTLRGAKRGSAGVPLTKVWRRRRAIFSSLLCCLSWPNFFLDEPKGAKIPPKCSPGSPKSSRNASKIDFRCHQKPSWGLCWAPHGKKLDFYCQKDRPEAPKSPQETPKWSEIWGKFRLFSPLFFDAIFQWILNWFLEAQNLKNVVPV